nr:transposase [Bryobacterales bacterium]
ARRKFFEASKLNPKDAVAVEMVDCMDARFAIDRQAREAGMDLDERHAMRAKRAAPLVERLDTRLRALRSTVLPKSALGEGSSGTTHSFAVSPLRASPLASAKGSHAEWSGCPVGPWRVHPSGESRYSLHEGEPPCQATQRHGA